MCPISGLVQFLIVIVSILLFCHAVVVNSTKILFKKPNVTIHMYDVQSIDYDIINEGYPPDVDDVYKIYTENTNIASIEHEILIKSSPGDIHGVFNITGNFLGLTAVSCKNLRTNQSIAGSLDVVVVRKKRFIDRAFTASVIILVSIIYINFGCALNWSELWKNIKRPIGPVIGFIGQFLVMPLLSFAVGKILFPESPAMQLGMFFTGVSPAGGASNVWTAVLEGNIDLSITMTTISTFAAFGMIPLWLFTLGKVIFDQSNIEVPYSQITNYAIALVVPLGIGCLIAKFLPKVGQFMVRILKCFSSFLILFIVIFAIVTNLYLFQLFSWKIILAGMGLPYLGYILAYLMAWALKQPGPNCLAIAIETGIQNTGIAIFLLSSLPQPQADLTTVAPVSVAIMTPIPLLCIYIYKKIMSRISASHTKLEDSNTKLDVDNNCVNNKSIKTVS